MKFISTRDSREKLSFSEALFRGLAPDGGLYQFENIPKISDFFSSLEKGAPFRELSVQLLQRLLENEEDAAAAEDIIGSAFHFSPELKHIDKSITVLELFHGPSCAFKDFGASFLAAAMDRILRQRGQKAIILTATSGDTGSAVAQAFHGRDAIEVVILYPSGRVSPLQEKQLTTLGGNVTALEIKGNFDDCQRMAKAAFTNPGLRHLPLSSANSINLGRLLPQSFYYVWAWSQMRDIEDMAFIVPSGNFGNLTAGLYAASWGMPINRFAAAVNANDVVPEYLRTGNYIPKPSIATLSNAMDVGDPSNFERLNCLYDKNVEIFRRHIEAWSVDDKTTRDVIREVYLKYGYVLCPHTAVGWKAAELYRARHPGVHTLILSTAHPGKFVETVEEAIGVKPQLPEALAMLLNKEKSSTILNNTNDALAQFLLERFD
ncbi:MAG: threonine synthase [Spirochaeta sp. LUC14_002_19_P3]|nr:MAG: threonine synthase [Spirochaeta sp. LUC14_002_19_P3]